MTIDDIDEAEAAVLAIGPRKHDVQPGGSRRRLVQGPISIPQATRSASAGTDFRTTPQAVSLLGPWEEKRGPAPLHRPGSSWSPAARAREAPIGALRRGSGNGLFSACYRAFVRHLPPVTGRANVRPSKQSTTACL